MKLFRLVRVWQSAETLDPAIDDAIIEAIKAGATLNDLFDEFYQHLSPMQYETEMEQELEIGQNCGLPTWHIEDEGEDVPIDGITEATAMLCAVAYREDFPEFGGYTDCYRLYLLTEIGLVPIDTVSLNADESIEESVESYWESEVCPRLNDFSSYKLEIL